jgi:hypothetical protein
MKNIKTVVILMIGIITFSSCKKEGSELFEGDYTYNTSGEVTVTTDNSSYPVKLNNRTGQMQIIAMDGENRVMIIKTSLTGNVTKGYATISGDEITFEPTIFSENITLNNLTGTATITDNATGKIYNNNTIVINEIYDGTFAGYENTLNVTGTINGDEILTIAKRNEE